MVDEAEGWLTITIQIKKNIYLYKIGTKTALPCSKRAVSLLALLFSHKGFNVFY